MTALLLVLALLPSMTTLGHGEASLPAGSSTEPGVVIAALVGGKATWYDDGPGYYGAAGPVLRDALGGDPAFRGKTVTVSSGGRSVTVRLTDWCACGDRGGVPTVIDLSADAFAQLAPLGRGVITVEIVVDGPRVTLPPTDTVAFVPPPPRRMVHR